VTPSSIRMEVVAERASWIRRMLAGIRELPLSSYEKFMEDPRNCAAAESYLRRALEGVLDLGRHVLAKGFGVAATEYKDIGPLLVKHGVLDTVEGKLLREMGGYRNRLVHFYHEVGNKELYEICTERIVDVERVLNSILKWVESNPEKTSKAMDGNE